MGAWHQREWTPVSGLPCRCCPTLQSPWSYPRGPRQFATRPQLCDWGRPTKTTHRLTYKQGQKPDAAGCSRLKSAAFGPTFQSNFNVCIVTQPGRAMSHSATNAGRRRSANEALPMMRWYYAGNASDVSSHVSHVKTGTRTGRVTADVLRPKRQQTPLWHISTGHGCGLARSAQHRLIASRPLRLYRPCRTGGGGSSDWSVEHNTHLVHLAAEQRRHPDGMYGGI